TDWSDTALLRTACHFSRHEINQYHSCIAVYGFDYAVVTPAYYIIHCLRHFQCPQAFHTL
ncbi:TPA: hypothetical protein ACF9ZH_005095, partial [Escherichia coli]